MTAAELAKATPDFLEYVAVQPWPERHPFLWLAVLSTLQGVATGVTVGAVVAIILALV